MRSQPRKRRLTTNQTRSRSKIKDQVEGLVFYFTSDISGLRTREEGSTKFGSCTKCEEANFALDTSAASASPKGLTATLRKQGILRANKPFSRSKKEKPPIRWFFFFYMVNVGREPEKRVRQNNEVHEVRASYFGIIAQAISPLG